MLDITFVLSKVSRPVAVTCTVMLLLITGCKDEEATPPPSITNFTPASGPISTAVTITGQNFNADIAANKVEFNGTPAAVTGASETYVQVTVPTGATTGKISITINGATAISADNFIVLAPPTITSISPTMGATGSSVTITGTGFNATGTIVKFGSITAKINELTPNSVKVTVPIGSVTGPITLFYGSTASVNSPMDFTVFKELITFSGFGNDYGNCMVVDKDGNYYITGTFDDIIHFGSFSLTPAGAKDFYVAKLDKNLNVIWAKSAGGLYRDVGNRVAVDGAGNVYVCGTVEGPTTVVSGALVTHVNSGTEGFIAKLDSSGDFKWVKLVSGSTGPESVEDVVVDDSGNVYMCGYFTQSAKYGGGIISGLGSQLGFFVRLDANGNNTSLFHILQTDNSVFDNSITANRIVVDRSGNYFVAGATNTTVTLGSTTLTHAGDRDGFVARFDPDGNAVWAKQVSGSSIDDVYAITLGPTGDLVVAGYFHTAANVFGSSVSGAGNEDIYVARLNSTNGNTVWVNIAGGPMEDRAWGLYVDANVNTYVTGHFESTATFGRTSLTAGPVKDVFVVKFNSEGELLFAKGAGSDYFDQGKSVYASSDIVSVFGDFGGKATFGTTVATPAKDIYSDPFIWRIYWP